MTSTSAQRTDSLLDLAPVVPVVVLDDLTAAVPLARALVAGGLPVIELTLRTSVALEAIYAISVAVPEIVVGAGTVTHPRHAAQAKSAGATFLVSPGSTTTLVEGMRSTGLPFLPGVSTVSEALVLAELGWTDLKFFPAEAAGGAAFLASLASPLPGLRFCPTGGITPTSAPDYLRLPNVGCVGGSWITPSDAIRDRDWDRISELAQAAAQLRPS